MMRSLYESRASPNINGDTCCTRSPTGEIRHAADAWLEQSTASRTVDHARRRRRMEQPARRAKVDRRPCSTTIESTVRRSLAARTPGLDDLRRSGGRTAREFNVRVRANPSTMSAFRVARSSPRTHPLYAAQREGEGVGRRRPLGLRAEPRHAGGLLPGPRRHPLRHREVAGGRAVRRHPLDGDQDRRPGRRQASSPTPMHAQCTRTRCWPTTCPHRSTGTPPA